MAKTKAVKNPRVAAKRMRELLVDVQKERKGSMADAARAIGLSPGYAAKLMAPEGRRRESIGSGVIGAVCRTVHLKPSYFEVDDNSSYVGHLEESAWVPASGVLLEWRHPAIGVFGETVGVARRIASEPFEHFTRPGNEGVRRLLVSLMLASLRDSPLIRLVRALEEDERSHDSRVARPSLSTLEIAHDLATALAHIASAKDEEAFRRAAERIGRHLGAVDDFLSSASVDKNEHGE